MRKRVRNVGIYAIHYYLYSYCTFSTQRWVSDTGTIIFPGKISITPSQVPLIDRSKTPEASGLWRILSEGLEKLSKIQIFDCNRKSPIENIG